MLPQTISSITASESSQGIVMSTDTAVDLTPSVIRGFRDLLISAKGVYGTAFGHNNLGCSQHADDLLFRVMFPSHTELLSTTKLSFLLVVFLGSRSSGDTTHNRTNPSTTLIT